ncbi:MAG: homoserine O-acetyltransferase [Candidatus Acidiferrales bacterium]|jgi:homoserine O-acetyltransferase
MKTGTVEPTQEGDFLFAEREPFRLESGGELQPVSIRYAIYGTPNPERDNVVLVCQALSGSARVADWWLGLFGPGRPFDLSRYCVIGTNVIGSCYGSTGPTSVNPKTGAAYGPDFPLITIGDMVRAQALLLDHLDIKRLRTVIGGSIGGMQALQWAVDFPERVETCVPIGATPLSAMGLALNHLQRLAIQADPNWQSGRYTRAAPPNAGLGLARALAMCSYKSAELFTARYGHRPNRTGEDPYHFVDARFDVAGYLDYQRAEFIARFDANTYVTITKVMDTFDVARGYGSEDSAFRRIKAKVLAIGISADWLFPPGDVRAYVTKMQAAGVDARFAELVSAHGHDAFLAEVDPLAALIQSHANWLGVWPENGLPSEAEHPKRPVTVMHRVGKV